MKTLQVATVGEDVQRTLSGITNFPAKKLVLVAYKKDEEICKKLKADLNRVLNLAIEVYPITNEDVPHEEMFRIIEDVIARNRDFDDFTINVGGGDKFLVCAAVTAAFLNGLKAFHCRDDSNCAMLPVLKLGHTEIISEAKMRILQAIDNLGGRVDLGELVKKSGYGKPLLSYHLTNGPRNLTKLGLVEDRRGKRGRLELMITTLGRLIVQKKFLEKSTIK